MKSKCCFHFLIVWFCVAITFAEDIPNGLFIAVGYGGRRMSSKDGITWENDQRWSDVAADDDNMLFNVAYGKGKFVAVGGATKAGHILVTRDGKEWKEVSPCKNRVPTIAYGNERFVAGHGDEFLFSEDGESWKVGAKIKFSGGLHHRKSAFGNGVFVAIGDADPDWKYRTSFRASTPDGEKIASFETHTPPARALVFGAGRFVVVGPDGLRESSADGKIWGNQSKEAGEDFNSVVWTGNQFVVGGGKFAYTSPDGITWSKATKGVPCSLLWAREKMFLGASWGGNMWSSTNPQDWKKSLTLPGPSFEAITWSPEARK